MKYSFDVSALLYLLEHLYKGTDLLLKSVTNSDAPFGLVHDIEFAHRCLFDAFTFVRNEVENVHDPS